MNIYNTCLIKNINEISNMWSPMDQFEIKPFFGELLGLNYTPIAFITNIMVYISLVIIFILLFYIYGSFKENIKINGWSFSSEAIYFTIYNMVLSQIGPIIGLFFFVFVFVLFIYILFSNLMGLIPYNFATTSHLVNLKGNQAVFPRRMPKYDMPVGT